MTSKFLSNCNKLKPIDRGAAVTSSVLYVDMPTFTVPPSVGTVGSDSIGFGITSNRTLRAGLARCGHRLSVVTPSISIPCKKARVDALLETYRIVCERAMAESPDYIFLFHILHTLPAELRRAMVDLDINARLVGYSHGSHWDSTDSYREEVYPGYALADLANLACMDEVFLVSEYMRETMCRNVGRLNVKLAHRLRERMHVVGLPIDVDGLESAREDRLTDTVDILYNHALIPAKRPDLFFAAARLALYKFDFVTVTLTRRPNQSSKLVRELENLKGEFGWRVRLGNDLDISSYFRQLWRSHIQVSTAEHESLGVGTLEAMYTGACCILPSQCCYPEIVGPVKEALYEPGLDGLVDSLFYYIECADRRRLVGRRLSEVAGDYKADVVSARLSHVLEMKSAYNWSIRPGDLEC